jgi:hypothetical protein
MAVISGYTSLQTEVASWLARSDLADAIPGFIQNFEERFYRQPKNFGPWMESALSVSFSSTATVPTDLLALRIAYLDGDSRRPLQMSSREQVLSASPMFGSSGRPKWMARDGANWIFGPPPDGTYTLNGTYVAKPALLRNTASDAAAHFLIVNAPDLLLYGALMEAQPYVMNDKRFGLWQAKYEEALMEYRALMKAHGYSNSSLQVVVV